MRFLTGASPFLLLLGSLVLFRWVWRRQSRLRSACVNLATAACSLLFCALIVELALSRIPLSDGFGVTLSNKLWLDRYWKPINTLGYRDREHDCRVPSSTRRLFVVGDSFVAGDGIENVQDRFSDVLQSRLGNRWDVLNIAKKGWNTRQERDAVFNHPCRPDAMVLSYFINDIEGAVPEIAPLALPRGVLASRSPYLASRLKPLVTDLYLPNLLYWRLVRSRRYGEAYLESLRRAYEDDRVWQAHTADLSAIADHARSLGIPFRVVVFPHLGGGGETAPHTRKVAEFFKSRGVVVIDLAPLLAGRDTASLVVSPFNSHPSVALNREVAGLLHSSLASETAFQRPNPE